MLNTTLTSFGNGDIGNNASISYTNYLSKYTALDIDKYKNSVIEPIVHFIQLAESREVPLDLIRDVTDILFHVLCRPGNGERSLMIDNSSVIFCAIDIIFCNYVNKKDIQHRLEWCKRIQSELHDSDVEAGWRVCFGKENEHDRYYYVNDTIQEKRVIKFNRS